jgi:hypothetical protein
MPAADRLLPRGVHCGILAESKPPLKCAGAVLGYVRRMGAHGYYGVGIAHLAFEVDIRDEVDAAHELCASRPSPGQRAQN